MDYFTKTKVDQVLTDLWHEFDASVGSMLANDTEETKEARVYWDGYSDGIRAAISLINTLKED